MSISELSILPRFFKSSKKGFRGGLPAREVSPKVTEGLIDRFFPYLNAILLAHLNKMAIEYSDFERYPLDFEHKVDVNLAILNC